MQHQSLHEFLSGQAPPLALWREIENEVAACAAATARGEPGHVLIDDGPSATITGEQVDRLLQALEIGSLPLQSGAYIADALIFSDDFDWNDDAVAEVLFQLSDESQPLTPTRVATLRKRLAPEGC